MQANNPTTKAESFAMIAAAILVLLLIGVAVSRLVYPFDVGHFEACIWTPALVSAQGQNPYGIAMREPFATAPYGYLYYLTVGGGLRLFGWQFWFGRALTILAAGICVYCLMRTVWRLTENRQSLLISALAFLSTITLHHWLGVHRPDLPALALAFAALMLVFTSREKTDQIGFRLLSVVGLLASGFFFKQTMLLPIGVAAARYWQLGKHKSAWSVLAGTTLVIAIVALALNATSDGGYFWQHFTLLQQVPHSYAMAGHWLASLFKSPMTWMALSLFSAALIGGKRSISPTPDNLKLCLRSPNYLWGCYFIVASAFAFVTSARTGAYINYYLEPSLVAAVLVGLAWKKLSTVDRWKRIYPALTLIILLAGVFEFSRMARAETYRWRSLPYYRELVTALKNNTPPDGICISVHPELVVAAGREFQFGDWIQYHDGRSSELRRKFDGAIGSGRYAAIVWLKSDDPALPAYNAVTLQTPLPEKYYPVFLLLPEHKSQINFQGK